jgi:hypothetical protein
MLPVVDDPATWTTQPQALSYEGIAHRQLRADDWKYNFGFRQDNFHVNVIAGSSDSVSL